MAVNVQLKPGQRHNRYELLAWINVSLQTRFSRVEQMCSGAAFCQLMDWLFPGSVDLSQVRFQPTDEVDFLQNYGVLQAGFRKVGVVQSIPVEELVQGNQEAAQDFLSWFKVFFDANHSGGEYSALEARQGQPMGPVNPAHNRTTSSGAGNTGPTPRTPRALTHIHLAEEQEKERSGRTDRSTCTEEKEIQVKMETEEKTDDEEEVPTEEEERGETDKRTEKGMSTEVEKTEKGMSMEVQRTDKGMSTDERTEKGMSTDEKTETGMSTEEEKTEKGMSTEVEKTEKGMSTEVERTETGMSTEEEKTEKGMSTEVEKTEKGMSTEVERTETGMSTEEEKTETEGGKVETTGKEDETANEGTGKEEKLGDEEPAEKEKEPEERGHEGSTEREAEEKKAEREEGEESDPSPCGVSIMERFISRFRPGAAQGEDQGAELSGVLGTRSLQDVLSACGHTPYTLYLYRSVDLGAGQTASLLLIGYFHQRSGVRRVRLLEALRPRGDAAAALLDCLRGALSRLGLPPKNLAWFYCDATDPEDRAALEAGVRGAADTPGPVSLCGLAGVAGGACQAAVAAAAERTVELIRDVHAHFAASDDHDDDKLAQQLFGDAPGAPDPAQCGLFTRAVQGVARGWESLVSYFERAGGAGGGAEGIRARLGEPGLRAAALFLAEALQPLAAFQEALQGGSGNLAGVLQLGSVLLRSYSVAFLRPSAVERFLRRRDPALLSDPAAQLQPSEVDVSLHALAFPSKDTPGEAERVRAELRRSAAAFYRELTRSLSAGLALSDAALRYIGAVLRPCGRPALSGRVVAELAAQLGVCGGVGGEEEGADKARLADEYLDYMLREAEVEGEAARAQTAEQHWGGVLKGLGQGSVLRRLVLTLLALPETLRRDSLLSQAFDSRTTAPAEPDSPEKKRTKDSAKEPASHAISDQEEAWLTEDTDTDHSSDVIEISAIKPPPVRVNRIKPLLPQMNESIVIDDEDDDDIIWTEPVHIQTIEQNSDPLSETSTPTQTEKKSGFYQDGHFYGVGELVWGHVEGYSLWPGVVRPWKSRPAPDAMRRVEWYGDHMFSEISIQGLLPFAVFARCFCANSFATLVTYREAIFQSLQVAVERSRKVFSVGSEDKEEQLKAMLDWAFGGFKPTGPEGLAPPPYTEDTSQKSVNGKRPKVAMGRKLPKFDVMKVTSAPRQDGDAGALSLPTKLKQVSVSLQKLSLSLSEGGSVRLGKHGRPKGRPRKSGQARKAAPPSPPPDECASPDWRPYPKAAKPRKGVTALDDCPSSDWQPPHKRTKSYFKAKESSFVYVQPNQQDREAMVQKILDYKLDVEGFCLCCGTDEVQVQHPLFEGGLCERCQDNFRETLYRYDEDGYQSYCTVCCSGQLVILCGNDSCSRSYCVDCLNILVGAGTFDRLKDMDPWICYLCQPNHQHGALRPRQDWSVQVQEFFINNSGMEFEPHRVYPCIPANQRRPIRVLSLFDGIATGLLVLKELGFKVEKYVASEICEESIAVSTVNHEGRIIHVNDARFITHKHIEKWGPFDLLIGGSPCNDLSIVNPYRKGLFEGTGRLFFEYFRILDLLKPRDEDPRPFFWMFENVVFMNNHDRINICRFLECNPVVVDAVKVSPAHRSRYFWGNIPGMHRPITASQNDKLNLQDCLEVGRTAKYTKVRTITTNPASQKQGKDMSKLPVLDDQGREDSLWITELERIFGFPKHYTDVKNMNRQQRQKVLGKSWSVPVIRHLFSPLKDYYACETQGCLATPAETGEGTLGGS